MGDGSAEPLRWCWTGERPDLDLASPGLRLTEAQRRACALDQDLLVRAGAGAGKTHTLSVRYLRLLVRLAWRAAQENPSLPRPDPDPVLVLTFTEKAAREMTERCHRRLLAALSTLPSRPEGPLAPLSPPALGRFRAALRHLCEQFDRARISTFHAFCARLLREFPAETGAPPAFTVLDALETEPLLREAIQTAFQERLDGDHPDAGVLLSAFGGRWRLLDAAGQLLRRRSLLAPTLESFAEASCPLETWLEQATPDPDTVRHRLTHLLAPLLHRIAGSTAPGPAVPRLAETRELCRCLDPLPRDPLATYALYRRALELLFTDRGTPRKLSHHAFVGTRRQWRGQEPSLTAARQDLKDLQPELDALLPWAEEIQALPGPTDRNMWPVLEALSRMCRSAIDRYESFLAEENALDFSALQERLVHALERDDTLVTHLQVRHPWIMVDEFQDTNAIQWQIVHTLGAPGDRFEGRLFLVGDPQQAIYGFRGGDVTVFTEVERDWEARGGVRVTLDCNFRSRPALVDRYNRLFGEILGPPAPDRPPWEASYEPVHAGRDTDGGTAVFLASGLGAEDASPPETAAERSAAEMGAVARLVARDILAERPPYHDLHLHDLALHPTPPVGILIRRRTRLPVLEHHLRSEGVPYAVAGGTGFWARPEVLAVANTLHALVEDDPLSRTGALLSSLFGLTHQDLWDLRKAGLFDAFGFVRIPARFHPRVEDARRRWKTLLRIRHRLPPSRLVRALLEETDADHTCQAHAPDGRAAANLDRLLLLAERFDDRSLAGTGLFARSLLDRIDEEAREEEATLAPDRARVTVMTIHAAKGLEFPVAVVPEIHTPPLPETAPVTVGRLSHRWWFATPVPDPDAPTQRRARSGLEGAIRNRLRKERHAESLRLLYVACTRAEDHLVLSGHLPDRPSDPPRTWADLLLARADTDLAPSEDAGGRLGGMPVRTAATLPSEPLVPPVEPAPVPPFSPARAAGAEPVSHHGAISLSPSGLDLYAACPARWFRGHVLGIPEREPTARERARELAATRGSVLHALLEDAASDSDLLSDPGRIRHRWLAAAHRAGLVGAGLDEGLEAVLAQVRVLVADPRLVQMLSGPGRSEVPFHLLLGGARIHGVMDRVYTDPDTGITWVLDYKTGRLHDPPAEAAKAFERQLRAYAIAAREILGSQDENPEIRAGILFTAAGEFQPLPPCTPASRLALESQVQAMAHLHHDPPRWSTLEARISRDPTPRPCDTCGYHHRGCRGWRRPDEDRKIP